MDKYRIHAWIGILFLLLSCTEPEEAVDGTARQRRVEFNFSSVTASVEDGGALSRSVIDNSKDIKQVWCVLLDSKENVIRTFHLTGAQTKKFYLEDIEAGNYSAIFMATTEDIPSDTSVPEDITQAWITNPSPENPFEQDYLYKRIDFTVNPEVTNQTLDVRLPRVTGRVELQLESSTSQIQQLIKKIEIVFDEGANIYTTLLGNGKFAGGYVLAPLDITQEKGFFSLPGENLSGKIRISQQTSYDNPEIFVTQYPFEQLNIVPGTISIIKLPYSHPEEEYGEIKVSESTYNLSNSTTMFLDSEPSSVINTRKFKVKSPLNVTIDTRNKQLVTRFFAPVEITDTKIMIRFKRYSNKFFYLARYDVIHPFQESRMDIPVMYRQCKFMDEDGEQVWIPAQEDLSESNCELKIVYADNEYSRKTEQIKCDWSVGFVEARQAESFVILNVTPELARHICVVAVNMAYMYSSNYFKSKFDKLDGLYDNNKQAIDKVYLLNKLLTLKTLDYGILEPNPMAQGYGGKFLTMYATYYKNHYARNGEHYPVGTDGPRDVLFHEFGHCLGYTHASNMTVDEDNNRASLWPRFCSDIYYDLSITGEIPVPTDIVSNLPR